ncbi:MAG: hypothetical protein ACYC61_33540 [Isosphaeraceae bacterium]
MRIFMGSRSPDSGPRPAVRGMMAAAVLAAFGLAAAAAGPASGGEPSGRKPAPAQPLVRSSRTIAQDQGAWVIDYRLRNTGTTGVIIAPEEIAARVEGWVSNSRVPSHATPRRSTLAVEHGPDFTAACDVIKADDDARRCRERLVVSAWAEDLCPCRSQTACGAKARQAAAGKGSAGAVGAACDRDPANGHGNGREPGSNPNPRPSPNPMPGPAGPMAGLPMSIAPGGLVHVRLRLEHQHVLYGEYDPLLAMRRVELRLGASTVRDIVPLDREQYLAQPRYTWPEPPVERRDTHHALSGPDSLHLEAHVPGHHYYRYPDRPVRYGTPMRLRFSYLVAAGTEGECRVRVAQYKDTPTSWRMLNHAGFEKCLNVVGRWKRVERVFTTDAEATTLALDFSIAGDSDVGEMWIDDVSLEPVGGTGREGP